LEFITDDFLGALQNAPLSLKKLPRNIVIEFSKWRGSLVFIEYFIK